MQCNGSKWGGREFSKKASKHPTKFRKFFKNLLKLLKPKKKTAPATGDAVPEIGSAAIGIQCLQFYRGQHPLIWRMHQGEWIDLFSRRTLIQWAPLGMKPRQSPLGRGETVVNWLLIFGGLCSVHLYSSSGSTMNSEPASWSGPRRVNAKHRQHTMDDLIPAPCGDQVGRCGGNAASQRSASLRRMMVLRPSFFAASRPALISA